MLAKHEVRTYSGAERVWTGKYKNSHNILHWHYDCELVYVESGSIDVFCNKTMHSLSEGDALYISSGEVHYMHAKPDTVIIIIIFDHNLIRSVMQNQQLGSPCLTHDYGIPELYRRLKAEIARKDKHYDTVVKNEIVNLMIEISRHEEVIPAPSGDGAVHAFKKLFAEINDKYEYYTFEDAAEFMHMSHSHFSRQFSKIAGMTFSHFLNYVKTENAVQMIKSDSTTPMTEIAGRCGFPTIRSFNRVFKALTGYQPKHLPETFTFDENFIGSSHEPFNPTLKECKLIDGGGGGDATTVDPFNSEDNITELERRVAEAKKGINLVAHDLIETE